MRRVEAKDWLKIARRPRPFVDLCLLIGAILFWTVAFVVLTGPVASLVTLWIDR
jgi:hypothetical protein